MGQQRNSGNGSTIRTRGSRPSSLLSFPAPLVSSYVLRGHTILSQGEDASTILFMTLEEGVEKEQDGGLIRSSGGAYNGSGPKRLSLATQHYGAWMDKNPRLFILGQCTSFSSSLCGLRKQLPLVILLKNHPVLETGNDSPVLRQWNWVLRNRWLGHTLYKRH